MDLSLCGAAPAGIRGDEDLFDWVSLQGEKEKRRRPRLSSNSIPSPMEFSLWRENPNLPFLRDRILSFQGLLGSLVHLISNQILKDEENDRVFRNFAVTGIWMKEEN